MKDTREKIPLFCAKSAGAGVDLLGAVRQVLESHWYVLGSAVQRFEAEFAQFNGVSHCASVANGTDALELALRALGVKPGDEVITVANAGFYSSTAILAVGAHPWYVDVEPTTMTMCAGALENALSRQPKAIVVTHLYGRLADMNAIVPLAEAAGIPVIEDCAQAHGAALNGRKAGSFGAAGCFSFYPTKNLGAIGDGGAIVTQDSELHARLRQLRQYGWSSKYHVQLEGGRNSRLDELQAAVLSAKLVQLDAWNTQRRDIARRYNEAFAGLPVQTPDTLTPEYAAHLYVLRCAQRDALRRFLADRGISTEVHYPVPDHLQAITPRTPQPALPITEQLAREIVTLPCFPGLADADVSRIITAVREFFADSPA